VVLESLKTKIAFTNLLVAESYPQETSLVVLSILSAAVLLFLFLLSLFFFFLLVPSLLWSRHHVPVATPSQPESLGSVSTIYYEHQLALERKKEGEEITRSIF
jgi:hypothetical protein